MFVNGKQVTPTYINEDFNITSATIQLVLQISKINAVVTFKGLLFSVELPFSLFQGNTEGQCGKLSFKSCYKRHIKKHMKLQIILCTINQYNKFCSKVRRSSRFGSTFCASLSLTCFLVLLLINKKKKTLGYGVYKSFLACFFREDKTQRQTEWLKLQLLCSVSSSLLANLSQSSFSNPSVKEMLLHVYL